MNEHQQKLLRESLIANLAFWLSPCGSPEDGALMKGACKADAACWDAGVDAEMMSRMMETMESCYRLIASELPEVDS